MAVNILTELKIIFHLTDLVTEIRLLLTGRRSFCQGFLQLRFEVCQIFLLLSREPIQFDGCFNVIVYDQCILPLKLLQPDKLLPYRKRQ